MNTTTDKRPQRADQRLQSELHRQHQFVERLCVQLHGEIDEIRKASGSRQHALCTRMQASLGTVADGQRLVSGRNELHNEAFDLHTVARSAVATLAFVANEHSVRLRCYVHKQAPRKVVGDKTRLARLIGDLVATMLAASEGGDVSVFVASMASDTGAPAARFTICDGSEAPDSAETNSKRRHTPWLTPWYAAVRELAERMGGKITVIASETDGVAISVTMAFDAKESRSTRTELATHSPVLLVSRDRSRMTTVAELLQQQGHVVMLEPDHRRVPLLLQQSSYSLVLFDEEQAIGNTTFASRSAGKSGMRAVPMFCVPTLDGSEDIDEVALLLAVQQRIGTA